MVGTMIAPTALDGLFQSLLTEDFYGFEGDNTSYVVAGEVTVIEAGTWHTLREDIILGGVTTQVNCRVRFLNPILSSIAERKTDAINRPDRTDFNATIVSNRELEVEGDDGSWVPINTAVLSALRKGNAQLDLTDTQLLQILKSYGFDQTGRLPMYLQHLGANPAAFDAVAHRFQEMGAKANTSQVAKRAQGKKSVVQKSYRHPEGVIVRSLDISHVDRSQSTTNKDAGFIGWNDALWNTLRLILQMDRERSAIKRIAPDHESYAAAQQRESEIRQLFCLARNLRAFRNWGGTSEVIEIDVLTETTSKNYYAQQVPCGRLSVDDGYGMASNEVFSVWGTKETNGTAIVPDEDAAALAMGLTPDTATEEPY